VPTSENHHEGDLPSSPALFFSFLFLVLVLPFSSFSPFSVSPLFVFCLSVYPSFSSPRKFKGVWGTRGVSFRRDRRCFWLLPLILSPNACGGENKGVAPPTPTGLHPWGRWSASHRLCFVVQCGAANVRAPGDGEPAAMVMRSTDATAAAAAAFVLQQHRASR